MGKADGYLKIKTKLDNSGIDKDVQTLENKIKKLQTDNEKASTEQNSLQKEIDNYEELVQKADAYKQKIKELQEEKQTMFANNPALAVQVDTPEYAEIKAQIAEMQTKYAQATVEIDKQAPKIDKVYSKLDKVKSKQTENNAKISEFKQKIEQIEVSKLEKGIDSVGKSIQSSIGKIGKMALAVFGIRTAFNAVRSVVSTLSQYNPQIAADIEYMKYALANTLLPVVQKLVSLAYTLLGYINAITTAWFGINLFGNSSAKNFQKMKNSASGTAKSAKEIQKSLQGFDEMNILQDNSNNDSGSGSSGVAMPSMDLSSMQGEVPGWLQWIIDNKDLILSVLGGITAGLLAIKLGAKGIQGLGIGVMVTGIIGLIQSFIGYLQDPSWENFGKIISNIGLIITGVGIIIASVLGIAAGAPVIIAGIITAIVGLIVSNWEKIKVFFQNGIDWLTGKSDWVHDMFGDTIGNIYDMFVKNLQLILDVFDNIFTMIKGIFDGFIKFIKGVFTGNWKMAWEGIKQIFISIWNGIKGVFVSVFNFIKNMVVNVAQTTGNIISNVFKAVVNAVLRTIENILNAPIRAINGLVGVINKVPGINLGYLNTFNLPRLAKGGVISQPTMAVVGEAGKEAVMPLENNTEWIDLLADKLASKIGSGGGSYIIQMDSRTIQRGFAKRKQELAFATNGR